VYLCRSLGGGIAWGKWKKGVPWWHLRGRGNLGIFGHCDLMVSHSQAKIVENFVNNF